MSSDVAYMALVYVVILLSFIIYVATLYIRQQRLRRELQSLAELEKSRQQRPAARRVSR